MKRSLLKLSRQVKIEDNGKGGEVVGPKWLRGDDVKAPLRASRRQEKRTAKLFGGVRTIGSGNKGMKGDVWSRDSVPTQFEVKVTGKKQIAIKRDYLDKLVKEAFDAGQEPVLIFGFEEGRFNVEDWAAIPVSRLKELLDAEKTLIDKS